MNNFLLRSKKVVALRPQNYAPIDRSYTPQEIFSCPEESQFYSQCLERMVLNTNDAISIVEFGAGDGSPVISSLLKSQFNGVIHGYELSSQSCKAAQLQIECYNLSPKYIIHNSCFFDKDWQSKANCLIANPPYLPAINNDLYMPALHGGRDGSSITKQLLSLDCQSVMLMISAYSDPVGIIKHAIAEGYQVADFMTSPMSFGYYSSEPKVKQRIAELHKQQKAFYSPNIYILAGVLFKKQHHLKTDLSPELIKIMTTL